MMVNSNSQAYSNALCRRCQAGQPLIASLCVSWNDAPAGTRQQCITPLDIALWPGSHSPRPQHFLRIEPSSIQDIPECVGDMRHLLSARWRSACPVLYCPRSARRSIPQLADV